MRFRLALLTLITAVGIVVALVVSTVANAHYVRPAKARTDVELYFFLHRWAIPHYEYVSKWGSGVPQKSHKRALRWALRRERELEAKIIAPWLGVAVCESGRNPPAWYINTGNGYYSGLQFDYGTWLEGGGGKYAPYAHMATPVEMVLTAMNLPLSRWPVCGAYYG